MNFEPTDLLRSPASLRALREIRATCPFFDEWHDSRLLGLAAQVAQLAYAGARESLWEFGRALEIPDAEFSIIMRIALADLYPVALVSGDAATIAFH